MTGALRIILGDQLTRGISALSDINTAGDVVLMMEVADETAYVPHHPKKIILILAAMRHFAQSLRDEGITVRYIRLDDPANSGSFSGEVARAVKELKPARLIATEPGEWRVRDMMTAWGPSLPCNVEIREDERFLCSHADFAAWAKPRKSLRMEYFYREMRKRYRLLLQADGTPEGGKWNFDADNRKGPPPGLVIPPLRAVEPDQVTRDVIELVERHFAQHFGAARPFNFPVTASAAEALFESWVKTGLKDFGTYQDAMVTGAPFLFHAVCSPALNIGLLDPLSLCRRVERAYQEGSVPLNAAEGFIRQIIGWREYVRGIYWLQYRDEVSGNALEANRPLPPFYWSGKTDMRCLAEVIGQTREEAYAHHIQRLMITGNFALIAGIRPQAVEEWYLAVYADAFEWVEWPNTHGMALYADGGKLASKPYAASGKYIARMSDYCQGCHYDPQKTEGPQACPFNFLYWDFIARNGPKLARNSRMALIYKALARMAPDKVAALRGAATRFLDGLSLDGAG